MEIVQNVWRPIGNSFFLEEQEMNAQIDELPKGIYTVQQSIKGLYLERIKDNFEFPYKIYGLETEFVDWVLKTYHSTNKNLGVLMNGLKGTGKTVTAEIIANKLDIPILIVNNPYPGLADFINGIHQNVVLLFDEFEKTFNLNTSDYESLEEGETSSGKDVNILTLMDGVLSGTGDSRKVFLLTTNSTRINENMIGRPGRIRYLKKFDNLSAEVVLEIINDKLEKIEFKDEIIDFVSKLEIITIDLVKAIIEEVNLHNASPNKFKDFFNVEYSDELVNIYLIEKGKKPIIKWAEVNCEPKFFSKLDDEQELSLNNGARYFRIKEVVDYDTIKVESGAYNHKTGDPIIETWKIERIQPRHKSFKNYTF